MASRSISSFFKPQAQKKKRALPAADSGAGADKKAKLSPGPALSSPEPSAKPSGTQLTPEQQRLMSEKKDQAMGKVALRKGTPTEYLIAPTWRRQLRAEFAKP